MDSILNLMQNIAGFSTVHSNISKGDLAASTVI